MSKMEKKTQEQLTKELTAPLPKEAVKPHPTKTYLSSIKAIYVTERLSQVFGIGAWRLKTEFIKEAEGGMIVVKVTLEVPDYNIYYESYGGNDNGGENSKNFDLGDAYKGATTDAITKIGSYLGIGIDVFKGKTSAPKQPEPPKKTPFTQKTFDAMKAAINNGDEQKVIGSLHLYDISEDFKSELSNLSTAIKKHLK